LKRVDVYYPPCLRAIRFPNLFNLPILIRIAH